MNALRDEPITSKIKSLFAIRESTIFRCALVYNYFVCAGVPPIHLLSANLVDLVSPNPAVGDKGQDLSRDLSLRNDKE